MFLETLTTDAASIGVASRASARTWARRGAESVVPFLVAGLVTGIVAADRGGYWPTAWGWSGLVLAWVAAMGLVVRNGGVGPLELAFTGGLAAFTGWTALSLVWTSSGTQTMLSVERTLVYVLAAAAAIGVLRSASYRAVLWGVWAGAAGVCAYGLATRLLPARLGVNDPIAGNRLDAPIGYWNGLGLLAAIATVLAVGLAARGGPAVARGLAAASLPLLLPTLYLTFSRGAWLALAGALAAAVALAPWRLELVATLLVQGAIAADAVWLVERAPAMHELFFNLTDQIAEGHQLAWQLPLVALLAGVAAVVQGIVAGRVTVPAALRRAFAGALIAVVVAAAAGVVVRYGGPSDLAHRVRRSLEGTTQRQYDLNQRLFTLSNERRLRQWDVALDEWRAHKALGGGAGTYAQYWAAEDAQIGQTLNAHNLYLETLAELGPFGLALLAASLLVPLLAAWRARHRTLVPVAAGAWVAFLVHVSYDWDWQLAGVTLAAIFSAAGIVAAARKPTDRESASPWRRRALLVLVLAAGALAFLGLLGNRALDRSGNAFRAGDFRGAAAAAADAHRWAPWSSQPWRQLAAVRATEGADRQARAAFREAVALDPRDWELWLGLAQVSTGDERRSALRRVAALSSAVRLPAVGP